MGLESSPPDSDAQVPPTELPEVRETDHDKPLQNIKMANGGSTAEDIASVLLNPASILRSLKEVNNPKPNQVGGFIPRPFFGNGLVPLPKS